MQIKQLIKMPILSSPTPEKVFPRGIVLFDSGTCQGKLNAESFRNIILA